MEMLFVSPAPARVRTVFVLLLLVCLLACRCNYSFAFAGQREDRRRTRSTTTSTCSSSNNRSSNDSDSNATDAAVVYDLLVVGGGVVGLAVCRAAAVQGYSVCLIERHRHLLHWASGSNSGIVCTGVDAAEGSLERALIRDSIAQLRTFYRRMNLPMRPCGSLVCQWPWDTDTTDDDDDDRNTDDTTQSGNITANLLLQRVLRESHDAGDVDATVLSPSQVSTLEPHLNANCQGAVHIPGEVVVDPWLHAVALAVHARQNGANICTNFEMDAQTSSYDAALRTWTIVNKNKRNCSLQARTVVSAAGLWADELQHELFKGTVAAPQFQARPRRGQYKVFAAATRDHRDTSSQRPLLTRPIQPIPTQRTKGIFLFSTLYDQIVIGPTATDQVSRTDRSVCPDTARQLTQLAQRLLGIDLATQTTPVGEYVGIRPGTDHRDYQIHVCVEQRFLVAAGIRSTGLSASLGIGRHVLHTLQSTGLLPSRSSIPDHDVITRPLPPVPQLAQAYRDSGTDESVCIDGYMYKVTHPLTRYGFAAGTGIAAPSAESTL